jgi:hypothetical protein
MPVAIIRETELTQTLRLQDGAEVRAIALPSFVIEELRRLKREQAEELLMLGVRQSGETLVCGRYDGDPMPPRSLTHEFAKVAGRVKDVPRIRFPRSSAQPRNAVVGRRRASKGDARATWPFDHNHDARLV